MGESGVVGILSEGVGHERHRKRKERKERGGCGQKAECDYRQVLLVFNDLMNAPQPRTHSTTMPGKKTKKTNPRIKHSDVINTHRVGQLERETGV